VIFLKQGKENGVRPNMAVITPEGIVGKVQRVFEGSSQVLFDYRRRVGRGIAL